MHVGEFGGDLVHAHRINTEALSGGEGLARKLQQHAFEDGIRHGLTQKNLAAELRREAARSNPRRGAQEACYSAFCSGLLTAMVSPASPTLNRAKRRTAMFSPNFPIVVAMSCEMVIAWSLMKGCS